MTGRVIEQEYEYRDAEHVYEVGKTGLSCAGMRAGPELESGFLLLIVIYHHASPGLGDEPTNKPGTGKPKK